MKEDNIIQLGDYDMPFFEYTHGSCYISLKFKSFDQFNTPPPPPPPTASIFRHLLSCGTIESSFWCNLSLIKVHSLNKSATVLTPQSVKIFTRLAALVKSHRGFNDSVVHL